MTKPTDMRRVAFEFSGKTVLISGGSRGIGFACAQAFEELGAEVIILGRERNALEQARTRLADAHGFMCDVRNAEDVARLVAEIDKTFNGIDVLVNCAGSAPRCAPENLSPEIWHRAMEDKFLSYMNVAQPVIHAMLRRGTGCVVNVIGTGGKVPSNWHLAGGAANAALSLATAGLARAHAAAGLRILAVSPGATATDLTLGRIQRQASETGLTPDELEREIVRNIPQGRMADPKEVANAITFLASDCAPFINGVNLMIDGAMTAGVL